MSVRNEVAQALDRPALRSLVVETNDGVIATASLIEGFAGAGWTGYSLVLAGLVSMVAGAIALGGGRYAEEPSERDARLAVVAAEQAALSRDPAAELAELASLFEARGLKPDLAREVAAELTAQDALGAHLEVEHQLARADHPHAPVVLGIAAACAYALGSVIPLAAVAIAPDPLRAHATFAAAIISLVLTSWFLARAGSTPVARTLLRTLLVASSAMLLSLAAGILLVD